MILSSLAYDPEEDEGRRRPSHVSAKEVRIVAIVLVLLAILLWPVIQRIRDQVNSDRCKQNLVAIAASFPLYAQDNNDRLPPLYVADESQLAPNVFPNGTEFTWVSLISRYMPVGRSFEDPGASDTDNVSNQGLSGGKDVPAILKSSYGMFGALSAFPINSIPSPSTTALIGDSCTGGANGSYDPLPFKDAAGRLIPDGIVIGFDTTNFRPSDSTRDLYNRAKYATRLAFDVGGKPDFPKKASTRHPDGVHILMADMHLERVKAPISLIQHMGKDPAPTGIWAVPY